MTGKHAHVSAAATGPSMANEASAPLVEALTRREREVLARLASDLYVREIAEALTLSPNSIKWYTRQIYAKLGVNSRREAIQRARELGLLESGSALVFHAHNLPAALTPFVGRQSELEQVRRMLADPVYRLLTLTGASGVGKTRLALRVTEELQGNYPQGAWLAELASLSDPELVPQTVAAAFELRPGRDQPSLNVLVDFLRNRNLLLVLDNCEHLVAACASLVHSLLLACPDLRILATSREALGIEGERTYLVPSLSFPETGEKIATEELTKYAAVDLFTRRAKVALPDFELDEANAAAVTGICRHLDGIPLALELAAARLRAMDVDLIASQLEYRFHLLSGGDRTAPPRLQTMHASIDWSYQLLSDAEKSLLRHLSVFTGGWSLAAARAVCADESLPEADIPNLLGGLVNKSLLQVLRRKGRELRYRLLETIRQYARDKLFETDDSAHIRARHLDYFIQMADQGFEELHGPNDLLWIEKLESENDNLRTALGWSLESPDTDPQKALQLSGALQDFWDIRGYTREGYHWLSEALKRAPDAPTSQRCRALGGAGLLCIRLSRFKDAFLTLDDTLDLARQLNSVPMIIRSLSLSAMVMENRVEARKRFEEGMALARATHNYYYLAESLSNWSMGYSDKAPETIRSIGEAHEIAEKLGNARLRASVLRLYGGIELQRGNYDLATSMTREALRLSQLLKDKHRTAHCLLLLGKLATGQTYFDDAIRYEQESLQIFRDLNDHNCSMLSYFSLGWNAYLAGESSQAIEHMQESLSIAREIDAKNAIVMPLLALGSISVSRSEILQAKGFLLGALEALKVSPDWTYWLAYCLEAVCAIPSIPPNKAARLLGKAGAIREKEVFVIPISEQHLVEPIIEKIQSQLGKEAFHSEQAAGMELTFQQAVEAAIEVLQSLE